MDLDTTIARLTAGARASRRPCWGEDTLRLGYYGELMKGSRGDDEDTGRRDVFFHSSFTVDDLKATDYELVDKRVCFVSGHMDLTVDEFVLHYLQQLERAYMAGDSFVVGDAAGADSLVQGWLATRRVREVRVFHMLHTPRNCYATWFELVPGYLTDTDRDKAMTEASDYDIAWVRPGREKSGTARNLKRRTVKDSKKKEQR